MAKILCVDDEEELRADIVEELQDAGHEVIEAANGKEALDVILVDTPDLVISDITMPVMDGYQLVKILRTDHHKFDDIPFIFLSALADRENMLKGMALGSDDYITKPIDFEMLLAKVEVKVRQTNRMVEKKKKEQVLLYKALQKKLAKEQSQTPEPAKDQTAEKAEIEQVAEPEAPPPLTGKIALVGRANKIIHDLETMLSRNGHEVKLYKSGRAYVKAIKENSLDLSCFCFQTEDLEVNQILARCGMETGARALIVPSVGVKNIQHVLKKEELDKLEGVIVIPNPEQEILKQVETWLKNKKTLDMVS